MLVYEREKFDKFVSKLIKEGKLSGRELPNESWDAVAGQLCYHFSLKGEKCPHWQNCLFLHVSATKLQEYFRLYRCMCGPQDGLCKYGRLKTCLYAHRQSELTVPQQLLETHPDYVGSARSRRLSWTNLETGQEVSFEMQEKYIANTVRRSDDRMCTQTHEWCNKKDCAHGVHITPEGWAWLQAHGSDLAPKAPLYFAERVRKLIARHYAAKAKTSPKPAPKAWGQVPASVRAAPDGAAYPALGAPKSQAKPKPQPKTQPKKAALPETSEARIPQEVSEIVNVDVEEPSAFPKGAQSDIVEGAESEAGARLLRRNGQWMDLRLADTAPDSPVQQQDDEEDCQ
eukprot:Skav205524  [mRNA]  locus=scaffold4253:66331:68151:+ [translate_table: standard]